MRLSFQKEKTKFLTPVFFAADREDYRRGKKKESSPVRILSWVSKSIRLSPSRSGVRDGL